MHHWSLYNHLNIVVIIALIMFSHTVLINCNSSIFLDTLIYHASKGDRNLYNQYKTEPLQNNPKFIHYILIVVDAIMLISKLCLAAGLLSKPQVFHFQSYPVGTYKHSFQKWEQAGTPFLCSLGVSVLQRVLRLPTRYFCQIIPRK